MIGKIGDRSLTRNLAAYRGEQEPKSGRYNRIANVIFDSTRSARDLILVCGAICNCEMWRIRILVQGPGGKRYLVPFNAPGWVETPFGDSKKIKQPDAPKDKLPTPRRNVRFEGPPSLDDPPPEKPVEYPGGEDTDPKKDKEKEKEGPKIEAGALPIYIHAYAAKDKAGKQTVVYIAECDEKKTDHHVDIPEEVTITDPIFLAGHSDIGFGGVGDPGRVAAIEKAKTWAKELNSNEMRLEVIDGVTLDGLLEVVTAAYGSDAALVVLLR
ncbi:MAG: hypothetical protein KDB90_09920 [Planctomycetes bacterium]|nr:hypothetical protein [Planctomycetota bacterium]